MFLTVAGKILPCERIGHQFWLGAVSDTSVELDFAKIAEQYNAYFAKLKKKKDNIRLFYMLVCCDLHLDR
jgi:uncharacterized protein